MGIQDMWKFAQSNAITRAALGMLAKMSSSSESENSQEVVMRLGKRFKQYDEHNSGKIDAEHFIHVLKEALHLQISSQEEKTFISRIAGTMPDSNGTDGKELQEEKDKEVKERDIREKDLFERLKVSKAEKQQRDKEKGDKDKGIVLLDAGDQEKVDKEKADKGDKEKGDKGDKGEKGEKGDKG